MSEAKKDESDLSNLLCVGDSDGIRAQTVGDYVVVAIHKNYLRRSVECAITTGNSGKVTNEKEMLECYEHGFMALDDGGYFNRCIDLIADDAIENGESWVEPE
jgi:hypothetical protein